MEPDFDMTPRWGIVYLHDGVQIAGLISPIIWGRSGKTRVVIPEVDGRDGDEWMLDDGDWKRMRFTSETRVMAFLRTQHP